MTDQLAPAVPLLYLQRVAQLLQEGGRKLLGLVGPPGAGKSTLALALHRAFPGVSQVVPMDGFHLANVELQRLGLAGCKGAPATFDSAGYVALLQRLRHQRPDETIYAPDFRRDLEEPVAGAVPIFPQTSLVITEGNYLLLESGHWANVAPLLDDIWFVEVDRTLRTERLTSRHQQFGRSRDDATQWVAVTDEPNARLIDATRHRASLDFRWGDAPASTARHTAPDTLAAI